MSRYHTICCKFRPHSPVISRNYEAYQEDQQVSLRIKSPWRRLMTNKNAARSNQNAPRDEPNLDSRYGEIGISAVAAALQYKSKAKTSADAPVVQRADKWTAD